MDVYLGQIMLFAGNFAPRGFAFCDGQILPISQNTALFSLLGTYYGGNGTSNFALPDLRGRAPVHSGGNSQGPGLSAYPLGESTGSETVTLTAAQIPPHSHFANAVAATGSTTSPSGALWAEGPNPGGKGGMVPNLYSTAAANGSMSSNALAQTGGSTAHANIQPSLAMSYCIALQGVYPPRS